MQIEIITKQDMERFKKELVQEIRMIVGKDGAVTNKQFLRSSEVRKLLKISPGTLQNLRVKGILPYEKIGGIFYYGYADIAQLLGEIGNS